MSQSAEGAEHGLSMATAELKQSLDSGLQGADSKRDEASLPGQVGG
jgi:hypothetical protein